MLKKILLLIMTIAVLGGCAARQNAPQPTTEQTNLPAFLQNSSSKTRSAYRYAMEHPETVAKYPCYCGCGRMGHTSNLDCYIQDIDAEGNITFDTHAVACEICVDITMDVARLTNAGKSDTEISTLIDNVYSAFGPATTHNME
jgi:hypothetical protein